MARRLPPFRPLALLFFVPLLLAPPCAAQQPPDRRVIDIAAPDGTKLMATYFAAGKPGPGVLLLHQCNRQRKVWDTLAEQLAAAGINVLTFDLRGFGESGGDRFDKLPPQEAQASAAKWPGDIDIAFQYLLSQPGVSHSVLGVGGASCGVNNAIQTARRHPEVKSLVLLSGNTDVAGRQFLHSAKNLPVLFAVADDDEFAPTVQAIEWLYDLAPNPGKKLAHYSTGGHGADIFPVHPDLPAAIVDWYVTTLIKTPGRAPAIANPPSMPQDVKTLEVIDQPGGAAKVSQMLQEARRRDAKATLFSEAIVNSMGYEHLRAGDTKGAIEILKLNASAYPDSPNVYDSLSDAYLADGQKDLARQNAKKALQLLPSDTFDPEARRQNIKDSAEQKLKQLGDPPQ
jgi:dienelactone hydrolase